MDICQLSILKWVIFSNECVWLINNHRIKWNKTVFFIMLKLEIFRRGCYSIHKPCSTEIWEIFRRQPVVLSNGTCINYFKLCFISIVLQRRTHKHSSQQIYSTQTLYRGGNNGRQRQRRWMRVYAKQQSGKLTYNSDFQLLLLSLLILSPSTTTSSPYKMQVFWPRTHFSCYIYLINFAMIPNIFEKKKIIPRNRVLWRLCLILMTITYSINSIIQLHI